MIVMEYADQGSLAEYMRVHGRSSLSAVCSLLIWLTILQRLVLPMPIQQVLSIAADAAAGVAFLHSRGVAHRDISGNVPL